MCRCIQHVVVVAVPQGMYLNHGLFLASIILSLTDMLISVFKLLR